MKRNLVLSLAIVVFSGCSSHPDSRTAAIPVTARPADSQLTISCAEGSSATTKARALLPSGSDAARCSVTVSHPGYEPASAIITRVASASRSGSDPVRVVLTLEPERPATIPTE